MNRSLKTEFLPLQALLLGAAAAAVRGLMYLAAVDDKNLVVRGHPLIWLLWLVCAAAGVLILTSVWKRKGSNRYTDNFTPGMTAAAGCWIFAAGIVLTLITGNSMQRPVLVRLWLISGLLASAGLIWAGFDRRRGRQPFLLTYAVLCLFLALQMVSRYQPWSGNPQALDWVFSLLGAVGLTLCAYHHSAFCAGVGHRRLLLATGLMTVVFCCAALPHTEYFPLYLCGGIWAYTALCRVAPVPVAEPAPESTKETE